MVIFSHVIKKSFPQLLFDIPKYLFENLNKFQLGPEVVNENKFGKESKVAFCKFKYDTEK